MTLIWCRLEGETGHEAGRRLLTEAYCAQTGEPLPELAVGPWGKPYIPGSAWQFSVSHTKRHAFCAFGDRPVGVDAEEADRDISLRLAEKILSEPEHAQFEAAEDKRLALLTFWVLKEAAAKLTGMGLRGYPNHTDFRLDDPRVQRIDGCLVAVLTEE